MPLYFFNISGEPEDTDGHELPDLIAAKCESVKLTGSIICDQALAFWDKQEWTLTVTNEVGLALFSLHVVGAESAAIR
jgi:1,4-alpha-glucan branching enzyme